MSQSDLVATVAAALDLSRKQADATVSAGAGTGHRSAGCGEEVKLNGFGAFELVDRSARPGRNLQTDTTIEIAASRTVKFKAAKSLRDALSPKTAP